MSKQSRTQNSKRNMLYGLIMKLEAIILPFVVRTVFIHTLGAEYLGLKGLFTSILTVLSLAEMGFASAVTFSLYRPIAEENHEKICALMQFFRKAYMIIGLLVLVIGASLIPFLGNLIKGSVPEGINIIAVYLLFLLNALIQYFVYPHLRVLVTAHQHVDVLDRIKSITALAFHLSQIIILLSFRIFMLYLILMPVFTLLNSIINTLITSRLYPEYKCKGNITIETRLDLRKRLSGIVISRVCVVSRNAFDSIFISVFVGLTTVAIYNNYYFIMASVTTLMSIIQNSISASVGNSIACESEEKNYNDMNKMNIFYMWLSAWCTTCLLVLYQPFMNLWVGESLMFPMHMVILICLYFYVLKMGDIRSVYTTSTGLWWEGRYRSLIEASANIFLNYTLGKYFGVTGILIATILTIFVINFGYGSTIVFKHYFVNQSVLEYFKFQLTHFVKALVACSITYFLCIFLPASGIFGLMTKAIACFIIPNILLLLMYRNNEAFRSALPWLTSIFKVPGMNRFLKIIGMT